MIAMSPSLNDLAVETQNFYRHAVQLLNRDAIPFLVGGAYALAHHTGIVRHTKDFDVFLRADDCGRALEAFSRAGYATELTFTHWLGKAFNGEDFVDFIFSSGNGVAKVDDAWFEHATAAVFLGEPVRLCPVEETIWSKSFVCERERYDGADINHLLLACGPELDWRRLLRRFDPYWRVLFSHLVLFGFAFPSERHRAPVWVIEDLARRLEAETYAPPPGRRVCQGTLLSRMQYVPAVEDWGYADARLSAPATMTAAQVRAWTNAGLRQ